jgi:hypothetical protein
MKRLIPLSVFVLSLSVAVDLRSTSHALWSWFSGVAGHNLWPTLSSTIAERGIGGGLAPSPAQAQTGIPGARSIGGKNPLEGEEREVVEVRENPDPAVVAETMRKVSPHSDPSVPFKVVEYVYSDGSREGLLAAQMEEHAAPGTVFLYSRDENGLQMVQRLTLEQYNAWLAMQGLDPLELSDPEEIELEMKAAEEAEKIHEKVLEHERQQREQQGLPPIDDGLSGFSLKEFLLAWSQFLHLRPVFAQTGGDPQPPSGTVGQQPFSQQGVTLKSDAIGHLQAWRLPPGGTVPVSVPVGLVRQIRRWQPQVGRTPRFLSRDERCQNPSPGLQPSAGGSWSHDQHIFLNSDPAPQTSSFTLTSSCRMLNVDQLTPALSTVDMAVLMTFVTGTGTGTFRVNYTWGGEMLPRGRSQGNPWFIVMGTISILKEI